MKSEKRGKRSRGGELLFLLLLFLLFLFLPHFLLPFLLLLHFLLGEEEKGRSGRKSVREWEEGRKGLKTKVGAYSNSPGSIAETLLGGKALDP